MKVEVKPFEELNLLEFHDLIALRIAVFVVEQNCPYQDLDGKDLKGYHLFVKNENDKLVGAARILPPGLSYPEVAIGRVLTETSNRNKGLGHLIMRKALEFIDLNWGENEPVKLSAQSHLTGFYENHGFTQTGKEYLEDGIPHTEMAKNITKNKL